MGAGRIHRFEDISEELPLLPLAARRALDVAGRRLSLRAWVGLPLERRAKLVLLGSAEVVDVVAVAQAMDGAEPPPKAIAADDESRLGRPSAELERAAPWLDTERWLRLSRLDRFALQHTASRGNPRRLAEALEEIVGVSPLTHLSSRGEARMVDVGDKPVTHRRALAAARVRMLPQTAEVIGSTASPKGDVLAAARVAGIMAAKRVPELVPLCHGVQLTRVEVSFDVDVERGMVTIKAAADAHDRTGVEMEAMVAASVAALTLYDMLKSMERGIVIEEVVLLEKQGGRSGHYRREPQGDGA